MPALIFNIYLNEYEKVEIFRNTFTEISHLFNEKHIKIRGKYASKGLQIVLDSSKDVFTYQDIVSNDWIKAFSIMLEKVKQRSVFIYLEDHKLVNNLNSFKKILNDFDKYKLDYLCYSWFYSSHLYVNNLLPLAPTNLEYFSFINLNNRNYKNLRNLSGSNFYPFSICSIVSTKLLKKHLSNQRPKKIYSKLLTIFLYEFFGYPRNRYIMNFLNKIFIFLNLKVFICPINTPANLEVHKIEDFIFNKKNTIKFGVLNNQLFTAVDDDNHHYGESLLKMGKFPFNILLEERYIKKIKYESKLSVKLDKNETYPLQYIPYADRYYEFPVLNIELISGKVNFQAQDKIIELKKNKNLIINSTHVSRLFALCESVIQIRIGAYD